MTSGSEANLSDCHAADLALQAQPQDIQGQFRVKVGLEMTLGRAQGGELLNTGAGTWRPRPCRSGTRSWWARRAAGPENGRATGPGTRVGPAQEIIQLRAVFFFGQALGPIQDGRGGARWRAGQIGEHLVALGQDVLRVQSQGPAQGAAAQGGQQRRLGRSESPGAAPVPGRSRRRAGARRPACGSGRPRWAKGRPPPGR